MLRLLSAILGMIGAASLRRVAGGLGLVVVGGVALGCALGFGAVALYQALLLRFEPWAAASLIAGALALVGVVVCWLGSQRLRRHPSLRELRAALPSLEPLAGLFGARRTQSASPLQMVAIAALVGFALGKATLIGPTRLRVGALACALAAVLSACSWLRPPPPAPPEPPPPSVPSARELEVTATAYNSVHAQTDGNPTITAYGIRLEPGMKIVAVSRDLEELGLREGVKLRIEGVDGEWSVGDRMHRRWQRKIDLYMGDDVEAAKRFGRRRVWIRW